MNIVTIQTRSTNQQIFLKYTDANQLTELI